MKKYYHKRRNPRIKRVPFMEKVGRAERIPAPLSKSFGHALLPKNWKIKDDADAYARIREEERFFNMIRGFCPFY